MRLPTLSAIAMEQTKATVKALQTIVKLLNYVYTYLGAIDRARASDIMLNIHSGASRLSEPKAKRILVRYYFMDGKSVKDQNIKINVSIYLACGVLRIVICSAAEAELAALFPNTRKADITRLILIEINHSQLVVTWCPGAKK